MGFHTLDAFIFCNRMKMERRCERSARIEEEGEIEDQRF